MSSPLLTSVTESLHHQNGEPDQQSLNPPHQHQQHPQQQQQQVDPTKQGMQFPDLQTFNHAVQLQQLAILQPVRSRLQDDEEPPKRKRGRPSKTEQEYLQKWYQDRGLDYTPPPKVIKNKPIPGVDTDGGPKKRGRKSQAEREMSESEMYNQGGQYPNQPPTQTRYIPNYDLATHSSQNSRHPHYGAIEAYIDSLPDAQSITNFMMHISAYARMRAKYLSTPPPAPTNGSAPTDSNTVPVSIPDAAHMAVDPVNLQSS